MGYNTRYSLKVKGELTEEMVLKLMEINPGYFYNKECVYELKNFSMIAKWYDHENDMRELSECFPGTIFTLEGEGEESGDLWRKYFLRGKMQGVHAEIIFEEFNPLKLR